ncbi:MAG: hypothetical protein EBR82_04840 [Caulobacteraceae bacterium]|nr:hypothetical protein [Caulobacteraceae bacterium]
MGRITREGDALRASISPDAVRVHSFSAVSDFDALQKNHDFHGWGLWRPEPDWEERFFTEDERAAQTAYLAERGQG